MLRLNGVVATVWDPPGHDDYLAITRYLELRHVLLTGKPSAVLFNSGFKWAGLFTALAGPGTLILADKLLHASLIDGIQGGADNRFRHNDMAHCEDILKNMPINMMKYFWSVNVYSMDEICLRFTIWFG